MSRRHERIRAPGKDGGWLYPTLLLIVDRDDKGRPRTVRVFYDDDTMGMIEDKKPHFLLVYMAEQKPKTPAKPEGDPS